MQPDDLRRCLGNPAGAVQLKPLVVVLERELDAPGSQDRPPALEQGRHIPQRRVPTRLAGVLLHLVGDLDRGGWCPAPTKTNLRDYAHALSASWLCARVRG